jgi:hypothetical protein
MSPLLPRSYAKYLDCGGDMLTEAAVMNWLSNGSRPNGACALSALI